jgi:hypothetical protein
MTTTMKCTGRKLAPKSVSGGRRTQSLLIKCTRVKSTAPVTENVAVGGTDRNRRQPRYTHFQVMK